jgi:hypothetical protein
MLHFFGGKYMKLKFLAVLSLAAVAGLAGCKSDANTNTTNTNKANSNTAVVATPTPVPVTNTAANTDTNLKGKIEAALKAKGYNDVTVDVSTTPATLRGTCPKDKLTEVVQIAQEANGGKPVKNEVTAK